MYVREYHESVVIDWQFHVPRSCLARAHQTSRRNPQNGGQPPPLPLLLTLSFKPSCCKERTDTDTCHESALHGARTQHNHTHSRGTERTLCFQRHHCASLAELTQPLRVVFERIHHHRFTCLCTYTHIFLFA